MPKANRQNVLLNLNKCKPQEGNIRAVNPSLRGTMSCYQASDNAIYLHEDQQGVLISGRTSGCSAVVTVVVLGLMVTMLYRYTSSQGVLLE